MKFRKNGDGEYTVVLSLEECAHLSNVVLLIIYPNILYKNVHPSVEVCVALEKLVEKFNKRMGQPSVRRNWQLEIMTIDLNVKELQIVRDAFLPIFEEKVSENELCTIMSAEIHELEDIYRQLCRILEAPKVPKSLKWPSELVPRYTPYEDLMTYLFRYKIARLSNLSHETTKLDYPEFFNALERLFESLEYHQDFIIGRSSLLKRQILDAVKPTFRR